MAESNVNGSSSLPSRITLSTFTAARIKEIQAMRRNLMESTGAKMIFQKLPRHMRRRAMSHVVKRLPRRLREIHINQMKKSGLPPKSKRPSRRYRRRPLNLQSEYVRRQRRIKWLDTHIWHAKRFHMIEKWGYKLPNRPCDKSFRACYRATAQHCLIQDLSYERCIEISGLYDIIMLQLQKITDSKTGLTFGAKCFYQGQKFGKLTVFKPNNEHGIQKSIGEIEFLWSHKTNEERRVLWLFVHPAFYKELLGVFVTLYELVISETEEITKIPVYYGADGIILRELEYELGKFRLTGPLSIAVLKSALRLVDSEDNIENLPNWFNEYPALLEQNRLFKELNDTSFIPPNMVFSLVVYDPRLNLPKKRTKALLNPVLGCEDFDKFQRNVSLSPLFNDTVRDFVKNNKMSNAEICELRSKFLIPGSELTVDTKSIIPIILLWRPGCKTETNYGYANGWEVIVPASWSQSFFISFVMWNARAGGLKGTETVTFESSQPDILYPDTAAGEEEEKNITETYRERFFRLPPNKRTNFCKFAIASPFSFHWKLLLSDWSGKNYDSFSLLRDRQLLKDVQAYLTSKNNSSTPSSLPENCIIPVQITLANKGVLSKFSIICVPIPGDNEKEPTEPKRTDPFSQKRRKLRREHKNLLQRLRRRRRRAVLTGKPLIPTDINALRDYKKQMQNLWLPEPTTIRNSCSRQIIGFIKHGGFSFTSGRSKGLGYIVGNSLSTLATLTERNKVLIRNSNCRQYRTALLKVLT